MPRKEEIIEIVRKRFGTSDEDLHDLGVVMDALDTIERADSLEQQIANDKLAHEKALRDLDNAWRDRYRERFFKGDTDVSDIFDALDEKDEEKAEDAETITIDEYLKHFDEKGVYHAE